MNNRNVAQATGDSFGLDSLMGPVALHLLGEPNAAMSKSNELRFGTHGSLSVDLNKGAWHDHEECVGGGLVSASELSKRVSTNRRVTERRLTSQLTRNRPITESRGAPIANPRSGEQSRLVSKLRCD